MKKHKREARSAHKDDGGGVIYQLKITLKGSKPPIWRRVLVPGDLTLDQLHEVIQVAMGWTDSHLHAFQIGGESCCGRDPDGFELDGSGLDESEYRLCDLVRSEKTRFEYEYDFGDSWEHTILLEKILPAAPVPQTMACTAGKGRCPPEDCGGIWGYYRMLEVLADPSHEEHEDMKESLGEDFNPDEFDAAQVSGELASLATHLRRRK